MRKEVIFAILAGLVFGLIIAFGVWRANVALRPGDDSTTQESPPPSQTDFGITIAKPQELQVVTTSPTVLSGVTKPNVMVVISAEDEDYTVTADENGEFEIDVDVAGGVNEIIIVAFDENGDTVEEKFVLVYSTELEEN